MGSQLQVVAPGVQPNAHATGLALDPHPNMSSVHVTRDAPIASQTMHDVATVPQLQVLTEQPHAPLLQTEFPPQVPPMQPWQVGVPHWQVGSGLPPAQFPLQSIAPPQAVGVLQVVP
jgi:hypothetical protein